MGIGAHARPRRVTAQFGILELTTAGRNEVRAVDSGFGVAVAAERAALPGTQPTTGL